MTQKDSIVWVTVVAAYIDNLIIDNGCLNEFHIYMEKTHELCIIKRTPIDQIGNYVYELFVNTDPNIFEKADFALDLDQDIIKKLYDFAHTKASKKAYEDIKILAKRFSDKVKENHKTVIKK